MSTTWAQVQTAIQAWAAGVVTPAPVIWAKQNAPRPARPYVTLSLSAMVPLGHDHFGDVDGETGARDIQSDVDLTVQVEAFAAERDFNGAPPLLMSLSMSLEGQAVQDALRVGGVGIVDTLPVQDLSLLRNPDFEGRAIMPVRFRWRNTLLETPGLIETVVLEGTGTPDGTDTEIDTTSIIGEPIEEDPEP